VTKNVPDEECRHAAGTSVDGPDISAATQERISQTVSGILTKSRKLPDTVGHFPGGPKGHSGDSPGGLCRHGARIYRWSALASSTSGRRGGAPPRTFTSASAPATPARALPRADFGLKQLALQLRELSTRFGMREAGTRR